jgi:hypothetical protein
MQRVFVSWSGDRSKTAALGLKSLLQDVIGESVDVFISAHMDPGVVWVQQLGKELEGSDFGILCLTEDNFQSPWLLFEAGAIAKNFGATRVVPYLIDHIDLTAPLSQFQHVTADRAGTLSLVESINRLREMPLPVDRLQRTFTKWWPDLEQTMEGLPQTAQPAKQSDRDLLEIIWQGVQTLINTRTARLDVLPLPTVEASHLLNLRDRPEALYRRNESLKKEMRMLRDLGLIRNSQPIANLPETFKLNEHFSLTDTGRRYVDIMSPPT